jgi:serine protease AprX
VRERPLSDGLYRGLAWEANLVLVKCWSARRIAHDDIRKGLDWVIRNRKRYGIRIANVSCGGDYEASYLEDALSQSAERANREGILVCAAAGNAGRMPNHPVVPPASAPSVLTVGGLDDKNRPTSGVRHVPLSYGPTIDGLQKPEVIAPGIFVAAPILPGTPPAEQARLLAALGAARDADLEDMIAGAPGVDPALDAALKLDRYLIEQLVESRLRDNNVISGAYKHVTAPASSPIVSSRARSWKPTQAEPARSSGSSSIRPCACPTSRWSARLGVVNLRLAVETALPARRPRTRLPP